jgi:hypothetical protein
MTSASARSCVDWGGLCGFEVDERVGRLWDRLTELGGWFDVWKKSEQSRSAVAQDEHDEGLNDPT